MALGLKGSCDFPVFFPVNGNFGPETGSLVTGTTARQSAAGRFIL